MEAVSKKATIFKNLSWSVVSETVFKLLGLAFFLVFTRHLGQSVLGYYTYIFAVLSLINLFWDLGINSHYTRKWVTDEAVYKRDIALIGTARLIIVLVSLLFFIPYISHFESGLWIEFTLGTLIYIADLFKSLPPIYFIAKNRFDLVFQINLIDRGLGYILAIVAIYCGFNLKAVLAGLLLAKIGGLIYGNYLKPSLAFGRLDIPELKDLLKRSLPLFLVGLFGSLYFRIDSVMIKIYLGFSDLGIYSAAYRFIDTASVVSSIMTSSVFPLLVSVQQEQMHVLSGILIKNIKYSTVLAAFFMICGIFKANQVSVFLFGQNFAASGPILAYLSPTLVFLFLNGFLLIQMMAMHKEHYVLKTLILLAIVNIGLNLYFIPHFGLKGAAITTLISEVLNSVLLYIKLPAKLAYGWLGGVVVAAAAGAFMLYALPVNWMLSVIASALAYGLILFVFGVLDFKDLPFQVPGV